MQKEINGVPNNIDGDMTNRITLACSMASMNEQVQKSFLESLSKGQSQNPMKSACSDCPASIWTANQEPIRLLRCYCRLLGTMCYNSEEKAKIIAPEGCIGKISAINLSKEA